MSIDTACSSSLVGTHLASTSFLSADCPRALVCGINLTMRAETTAVLSKAGMLAQVISQHIVKQSLCIFTPLESTRLTEARSFDPTVPHLEC